jgi:glyoxylase I family protein
MTTVPIPCLDHLGLTCADLTTSLRFYHELLGMPMVDQGEGAGRAAGIAGARVAYAMLDAGNGHRLELLEYLSPRTQPAARMVQEPGAVHVALRVGEFDQLLERLGRAGFTPLTKAPVVMANPAGSGTIRLVYVTDPDRHVIELTEYRSADGPAAT